MMKKKVSIVLENGMIFSGERFGADVDAIGELVFSTAAVGYIETLTDANYSGQIGLQTFPLIGNYGMIPADCKGAAAPAGYVCYEHCETPSNFRSEGTLDAYLKEVGIPGVSGIDTRELTRILRDEGAMNAAIVSDPSTVDMDALRAYKVKNAVAAVSPKETKVYAANGEQKASVALLHCGTVRTAIDELTARGCRVTVYPADTKAETILADQPDGILISDGPGDPAENTALITEIGALLGQKPIFAYGLGHQLLAIAAGGETAKLPYGHRGANQPVKFSETGRVYISSQNHGYVVSAAADGAQSWFENVNDHTCEGLVYPALRAFSVQFAPETCAELLFDRFAAAL